MFFHFLWYNLAMRKFSYNHTLLLRKNILTENANRDHVFLCGKNNVLISAPHGVSQTRLGKHKVAEIGTIPLAVLLANATGSHALIKTKNNYDDANFDSDCMYRRALAKIIKEKNIKYLIDFHGLASHREMDINLGTNFGNNTKVNEPAFKNLLALLKKEFKVVVDQPFMASETTISGHFSKEFNIFTIQIEVNCKITNRKENIADFNNLASLICEWINSLN